MKKVYIILSGLILILYLIFKFIIRPANGIIVFDIPFEFILFSMTLLLIAVMHRQALQVAISGFILVLLYKVLFDAAFPFLPHFLGTGSVLEQLTDPAVGHGEWKGVLNLLGLLIGFAMLARHFELSGVPGLMPKILPANASGPFLLLLFVFILSSFLDNIAAAMIGGTLAVAVFKKIHVGFIVAIVAASNAGGAGSVIGDTTTTMMWVEGVAIMDVFHAYIAAVTAFAIFAIIASRQQNRLSGIQRNSITAARIDGMRLFIVALMLAGAVLSNIFLDFPAVGVWLAIGIGALLRSTPWKEAAGALKGAAFLLALISTASLMPVESLPDASAFSTLMLGFVSAFFDNIPLTKLALEQGGYDWGVLAYAVGFGGSMIWFGSSAGVAITGRMTEARNVWLWLKHGWHVVVAYVIGFAVMGSLWGWHPE